MDDLKQQLEETKAEELVLSVRILNILDVFSCIYKICLGDFGGHCGLLY